MWDASETCLSLQPPSHFRLRVRAQCARSHLSSPPSLPARTHMSSPPSLPARRPLLARLSELPNARLLANGGLAAPGVVIKQPQHKGSAPRYQLVTSVSKGSLDIGPRPLQQVPMRLLVCMCVFDAVSPFASTFPGGPGSQRPLRCTRVRCRQGERATTQHTPLLPIDDGLTCR